MDKLPLVAPIFPAGREPLPPGFTEDDRVVVQQQKNMEKYMGQAMESCVVKTTMAGGMGAHLSLSH